jgi:hypothetical protein
MRTTSACAVIFVILLSAQAVVPWGAFSDQVDAPSETVEQAPAESSEAIETPAQTVVEPADEPSAQNGSIAREEQELTPMGKDPFIAGLLSWFMLGIGQIYCREYTKGSLFIAAGFLDKVALILLVSHINDQYAPSSGTATINWSSFEDGTKAMILVYLAASLGLRFYSTVDAIQSANKYNERVSSRGGKSAPGGLSFAVEPDRYSLSYSFRLNE